MAAPKVSVVIPVYNEEAVLPALFARLYPALDALGESYEVIFVNDGSSDRSAALLRGQFELRSDVTRVILFNGNFGQHLAIMAGFEATRGERVVTLDADLQNPPEEIAKLLAKMDEGYDYVGSVRRARQDTAIRRVVVGPEAEGVFTLFGIAFFLIGITLFGIGLLGEYVGRIYEQVRQRPRYLVQAVLERNDPVSAVPKQRQIS